MQQASARHLSAIASLSNVKEGLIADCETLKCDKTKLVIADEQNRSATASLIDGEDALSTKVDSLKRIIKD